MFIFSVPTFKRSLPTTPANTPSLSSKTSEAGRSNASSTSCTRARPQSPSLSWPAWSRPPNRSKSEAWPQQISTCRRDRRRQVPATAARCPRRVSTGTTAAQDTARARHATLPPSRVQSRPLPTTTSPTTSWLTWPPPPPPTTDLTPTSLARFRWPATMPTVTGHQAPDRDPARVASKPDHDEGAETRPETLLWTWARPIPRRWDSAKVRPSLTTPRPRTWAWNAPRHRPPWTW